MNAEIAKKNCLIPPCRWDNFSKNMTFTTNGSFYNINKTKEYNMKKRFAMLFVLLVAAVIIISPSVASATQFYISSAQITKIGVYPSGTTMRIPVFLTDAAGTFTNRMFFLHSTCGKEGLATLLTAFSMDKNVYVGIVGAGTAPAAGDYVNIIYVNR